MMLGGPEKIVYRLLRTRVGRETCSKEKDAGLKPGATGDGIQGSELRDPRSRCSLGMGFFVTREKRIL
jgi:hypothetical protein